MPRAARKLPENSYKYKDTYPAQLVATMGKGRSLTSFCRDIGVARSTVYEWLDNFPEFQLAYEKGQDYALAWWEEQLQDNLITPSNEKFNSTGWSMVMRNRFDYTDARKIRVKGLASAETLADKFKVIAALLDKGLLTASESAQLMQFLTGGAKILESSEMLQKLDNLEKMLSNESSQEIGSAGVENSTDENN